MSLQPISLTIPNRKPFVRCPTFIDGKGPPPHDFFDETQDHLSTYYHMRLGSAWSCHTEDFDNEVYPAGFLGQFSLSVLSGLTLAPVIAMQQGEAGVWSGASSTTPFAITLKTNSSFVGTEDFLFAAKVKVLNRSRLDALEQSGFRVSMGGLLPVNLPGFAAGGNSPNWHLYCPLKENAPPSYLDTEIPLLDQTWYLLEWSRFQGGMRFFINGRLISIQGQQGMYVPTSLQGVYRYVEAKRSGNGPTGDGFSIDFFHCLLKRTVLSP